MYEQCDVKDIPGTKREMLFRAVTLEGHIIKDVGQIEFFSDGVTIVNEEFPVQKLLQYIGQVDKNGEKLFEDDIVRQKCQNEYGSWTHYIGVVRYHESHFCIQFESEMDISRAEAPEKIGNLWENPELLPKLCPPQKDKNTTSSPKIG